MGAVQTAPNHAREYETIYILRPDIDADSADRLGQRVQEVVGREKGRLLKVEGWGRRRLAYPVAKHRRGVYMYLRYLGTGALVNEIERNLRLADDVLKYQSVLLRDSVPLDVAVSPEDVRFERLELPPEEEREETRERILGLLEPERRQERAPEVESPAEEGLEGFEEEGDFEGEEA